jgi:hypothetical protein
MITGGIGALTKIGANLVSPSFSLSSLQIEQIHYWQVVAHTASGDIFSPYWWFFVPRPTIQIERSGNECVLFWPRWVSSFALQATPDPVPADWRMLSGVQTNSDRVFLQLTASGQSLYFRLQSP